MHRAHSRQKAIRKTYQSGYLVLLRLKHLLWLAILAIVVYYFFLSDSGVLTLLRLKKTKNNLQEQVRILQRQQTELQATIDKLKNDPDYIEKLARERLKLTKKGETIYLMLPQQHFQPQDSSK
ncbi:hypothetical protein DRQ12_05475 [candidate division KSB1 bacterium]|nr:MAG: hypothetical protein B5M50_06395 [candidate division KSB1 bacterium 4484_219]RKY78679.1 MAG: hypothetical protein DRQ12_05475 [candidate division KSB1 bacterium]HDI51738.1 septum formation initiator family protein [Bacteroidota bacterium]